MNFYKDGVLSANATNFKTGHVIRSGGSLMLGQEQDSTAPTSPHVDFQSPVCASRPDPVYHPVPVPPPV